MFLIHVEGSRKNSPDAYEEGKVGAKRGSNLYLWMRREKAEVVLLLGVGQAKAEVARVFGSGTNGGGS